MTAAQPAAGDLLAHLARLSCDLRLGGARVSLADELDGAEALLRLDLGDRAEVRRGLRCALKIRRLDVPLFEHLFAQHFSADAPAVTPEKPRHQHQVARQKLSVSGLPPRSRGEADEQERPAGEEPGASAEAVLRHKPFEECDARDLAAMERLLHRLARKLATRRSRRLVPSHGRGRPDLRRTLRRTVATLGEPVWLALRDRPVETPRLLILIDTSASMEPHARFVLAFAYALRRVARTTEVFAFNTALTRVTPWLRAGALQAAIEQLLRAVPDWSGGTRIGECLQAFVDRHLAALVDPRTVVIVLSDGLDRGDPALIPGALRALKARCRKLLWLNPLLSDPRFEPTARAMAAALPYVDHLAPAHDLASLERLVPHLSA